MTPAQLEMDAFERELLCAVFGADYQQSKAFKLAETFFPGRVQSYINRFEALVGPFMNADGTTDGVRLKKVVALKYPTLAHLVPEQSFRLTEIAGAVKNFTRGAI